MLSLKKHLPARNLHYIGLRDLDPYETYLIKNLNISYFSMKEIDKYGIAKVLEMILDSIDVDHSLHVSFDIDSLDIPLCPSTGTPVLGGLTLREAVYTVETLAQTKKIRGFDLVEINPKLGKDEDVQTTLRSGIEIIKAAFGHSRMGLARAN